MSNNVALTLPTITNYSPYTTSKDCTLRNSDGTGALILPQTLNGATLYWLSKFTLSGYTSNNPNDVFPAVNPDSYYNSSCQIPALAAPMDYAPICMNHPGSSSIIAAPNRAFLLKRTWPAQWRWVCASPGGQIPAPIAATVGKTINTAYHPPIIVHDGTVPGPPPPAPP